MTNLFSDSEDELKLKVFNKNLRALNKLTGKNSHNYDT